MAGRIDEEESAVDAGVLDVAVTHGCQLFAKVGTVLVLDVLDDRVPTARTVRSMNLMRRKCRPVLVVDLVAVAWGVDDVETKSDAILGDD